MYAKICLSLQSNFSSKHSVAIYELCIDYFDVRRGYGETPFIPIATFRELMGVGDDEYPTFWNFGKRIIKEPIQEINKKADINVDFIYKKERRRIVAVKFTITKKSTFQEFLPLPPSLTQEETKELEAGKAEATAHLFERLQAQFGLTEHQAKNAIETHDPSYIDEIIEYVISRYKEGKVNNITSFTVKALKEDFRPKKAGITRAKEDEKERIKTKIARYEQAKRQLDRLNSEIDSKRKKKLREILEAMEKDEQEALEKRFSDKMLANEYGEFFLEGFKKDGFNSPGIKGFYFLFQMDELLPSARQELEGIAKENGLNLEKIEQIVRDGKY